MKASSLWAGAPRLGAGALVVVLAGVLQPLPAADSVAAPEKSTSPANVSVVLGEGLARVFASDVKKNPNLALVGAEWDGTTVRFYSAGNPGTAVATPPEKTLFEIGSITKVFTALLLGQAVVEKRVTLDDPIRRFLPESVNLAPSVGTITLRQLATHTAGLPRMPDNFKPADDLNPFADYRVADLHRFLESFPQATPTPAPEYSNLGIGVLGYVLSLVYAKPYADLLAEKITGPLGLRDTAIGLSAEQKQRLAEPRDGRKAIKPWTFDVLMGCGALYSTASDLVQFAQALMAEKSPVAEAWRVVREPQARSPNSEQIGLAVFILRPRGETVSRHNGATGGYRAVWSFSPRTRHALVILANNTEGNPGGIADVLYHPPAPVDEAALAAARKERQARPAVPLSKAELEEYVGIYRRKDAKPGDEYFTIVIDEAGRLRWRLKGHSFRPIIAAGHDRFFSRWTDVEVRFERGEDGKIAAIVLTDHGDETAMIRAPEAAPTVKFLSADALKAFTGNYRFGAEREYTITLKDDQLYAKITGQPACPVFADGVADHFVYDVVQASLTFERDATGAVKALVLHQNGKDISSPKLAN